MKKIEIEIDKRLTPEAKGERLRRVRNLANLSREAFCSDGNVNIHTLAGWELGRFGGLSRNGAIVVVHRVYKEGVCCTADWLLNEIGSSPFILPDFKKARNEIELKNESDVIPRADEENKLIAEELICFRSHYKETLDLIIQDDSMSPIYNIGDYVAGKKISYKNISKLIGMDCIVNTSNGLLLLRNVRKGSTEHRYNLISNNPQTQVPNAILHDIEIVSIASIYWHRRKDLF